LKGEPNVFEDFLRNEHPDQFIEWDDFELDYEEEPDSFGEFKLKRKHMWIPYHYGFTESYFGNDEQAISKLLNPQMKWNRTDLQLQDPTLPHQPDPEQTAHNPYLAGPDGIICMEVQGWKLTARSVPLLPHGLQGTGLGEDPYTENRLFIAGTEDSWVYYGGHYDEQPYHIVYSDWASILPRKAAIDYLGNFIEYFALNHPAHILGIGPLHYVRAYYRDAAGPEHQDGDVITLYREAMQDEPFWKFVQNYGFYGVCNHCNLGFEGSLPPIIICGDLGRLIESYGLDVSEIGTKPIEEILPWFRLGGPQGNADYFRNYHYRYKRAKTKWEGARPATAPDYRYYIDFDIDFVQPPGTRPAPNVPFGGSMYFIWEWTLLPPDAPRTEPPNDVFLRQQLNGLANPGETLMDIGFQF
jgi:hypothetical protein